MFRQKTNFSLCPSLCKFLSFFLVIHSIKFWNQLQYLWEVQDKSFQSKVKHVLVNVAARWIHHSVKLLHVFLTKTMTRTIVKYGLKLRSNKLFYDGGPFYIGSRQGYMIQGFLYNRDLHHERTNSFQANISFLYPLKSSKK